MGWDDSGNMRISVGVQQKTPVQTVVSLSTSPTLLIPAGNYSSIPELYNTGTGVMLIGPTGTNTNTWIPVAANGAHRYNFSTKVQIDGIVSSGTGSALVVLGT